ncbi:MAG: (d)CMP kinase [Chloroflexi bacterium]|nr:(d)CMP kinase [Chloroflexota bacterium]
MPLPSIIAIDGTSASGKSTIGGLLANHLGYVFFDTGVMYRAVTWVALSRGIPISDEEAITQLARDVVITVERPHVDDGRPYTIRADGEDITWEIRSPEVDAAVSPVSAYPGVRAALTVQQRRIGQQGRIVMVGRDIGTVVLPEADLKIFMDATPEERARRRMLEMRARGANPKFEDVLAAIRRRDRYDSERAVAPLTKADDAVYLDTTELSVEGVLERVLDLVENWDCEEKGQDVD